MNVLRSMTTLRCCTAPFLLVVLALVGCGPRSDRLAISGVVTLNGAPLDNGSIRFSSQESAAPMSAGAMIQDGAYRVPQDKGLRVGTYQVEISSPDAAAPLVLDRASGMKMAPERIPLEYNVNTQQTIEVTADGDNQFDFTITNKPAA